MFKKDFLYYFHTPIGYIVIGIYLLAITLFLWVVPGEYNILDSGYAQVDGLFRLSPWLFMMLCPALCMRLFAEEVQTGTWVLLKTKPIALSRLVWEKFAAAWTLVVIAQLPCLVHYLVVYLLAEPTGNIDSGAFFGAFLGLIFLSAAFCAICTWASSLTRSQIVAFIIGLLCCFLLFYGFDLASSLFSNGKIANAIKWFGFSSHYISISRGVIDLKDIVYFASVSVIFLVFTQLRMAKK